MEWTEIVNINRNNNNNIIKMNNINKFENTILLIIREKIMKLKNEYFIFNFNLISSKSSDNVNNNMNNSNNIDNEIFLEFCGIYVHYCDLHRLLLFIICIDYYYYCYIVIIITMIIISMMGIIVATIIVIVIIILV